MNTVIRIPIRGVRYVVDTFMILLNLSMSYSIIPYLVFRSFNRYTNIALLIILDLVYIFLRFYNNKEEKEIDDNLPKRNHTLISLYVAINLVCFFSGIITGTSGLSTLLYLVLNVELYWLLCKLFDEYLSQYSIRESYYLLVRGYIFLVLLSLFGCLLLFIYIKMGGSPFQNPIGTKYDLFYDDAVNFGSMYYFPFHICIIDTNPDIRIPFFQEAGFIEGLYHEPHCMTFMVFPALFLLLFYSKDVFHKVIWILFYLFIVLLSGSTTNIAAVLVTLVVYMFYTLKSSLTKSFIFFVVLSLVIGAVYMFVDLTAFEFIINKIEGGSKDYSVSTLNFAMHPKTVLGTSFYNLAYVNSSVAAGSMDVGWIMFFLNGGFLLICINRLIKLFIKNSSFSLSILLFAVYFFAHSAKVAMISYSLTMLIFVVFLIEETTRFSDDLLEDEESVN